MAMWAASWPAFVCLLVLFALVEGAWRWLTGLGLLPWGPQAHGPVAVERGLRRVHGDRERERDGRAGAAAGGTAAAGRRERRSTAPLQRRSGQGNGVHRVAAGPGRPAHRRSRGPGGPAVNREQEKAGGSARGTLWGRIACGWAVAFAALHFSWGLGGDAGLSVAAGPLATERPLWFVVAGLWGVGGLCLLGALLARLLTRSDLRGGPPRLRGGWGGASARSC